MKRISEFAALLALLGFAACSGSNGADKNGPGEGPERGQMTTRISDREGRTRAAKPAADAADLLSLSAVRLSPADINAAVDISAEAVVAPPVPEGIEFEYRWFISDQEVADATDATLKSGSFRKNQWIFCQARATAGGKTSAWLKSNWVKVANSPPQAEPITLENFAVPGQFHYQIKASDIDNDELSYELIAPLNEGIVLDKKSGLLSWEIDEKTIEKLGETIEISLRVSDNDAEPTIGSLTLRFQKTTAE